MSALWVAPTDTLVSSSLHGVLLPRAPRPFWDLGNEPPEPTHRLSPLLTLSPP
jgi:hypothetical protein